MNNYYPRDYELEGGPLDGQVRVIHYKTEYAIFAVPEDALQIVKTRKSSDEPFTTTYPRGIPAAKYRREERIVYVYEGEG